MLTAITLAALILGAVWGCFFAFIRDQDAIPGVARTGANPFKEIGIAVVPLPLAAVALIQFGWIEATVVWALGSAAWSLGHMGGMGLRHHPSRTGLSVPMSYVAMAGTGAAVTLGAALVLGWHGHVLLAAACLIAGAAKAGCYEAGFLIRGLSDQPPHATFIGALASGALAWGVALAALVAA